MLPLWIIDITDKSPRRDFFESLVKEIHHTHLSLDNKPKDGEQTNNENNGGQDKKNPANKEINESDNSTKDILDARDKRLAAKRTTVYGDYWFYSQVNCDELPESLDSENITDIEIAEKLYSFQNSLVEEGIDFIETLRKSNAQPYQTINIAVLGDITERQSQLLFASIASMLQKEKGRFLPHHIHQGMEIMGMLYIPCDVNTKQVCERVKIQRTLKEIEVQHTNSTIRGYDHIMLYQNVQNRTECNYPMLDPKGQAEYLLQCLIHLFYACDTVHPLLSGTGSADDFFFSMGATSAFFNMDLEDETDCTNIAYNIVSKFKEKGNKEKAADKDLKILKNEDINAKQFIQIATDIEDLDIYQVNLSSPNPHPIKDYLADSLKRIYYLSYLRRLPIDLMNSIIEFIDDNTKETLQKVSIARKNAFRNVAIGIKPSINNVIKKITTDDGGLFFIEELFKDAQGRLSKEKAKIKNCLEVEFWSNIQEEHVPRKLRKHFEDYHTCYTHDNETKNDGSGCADMKKEALKDLSGHISQEPTLLSIICRCVLLGIIFSLAIVPILNILSPHIIDLGRIKRNSEFWFTFTFFIPTLMQFIKFYLYQRKKNMYIRVLKSYFLHDAFARVANRIEMESAIFYDRLTDLCGEYLERCKMIRKDVHIEANDTQTDTELPLTLFNINLNGGTFGGETIIPDDRIKRAQIRVAGKPRFVNELNRELYYILINNFSDKLEILFNNVDIRDNKNMILDEASGRYIFRSHSEIEKEDAEKWQDTIKEFKSALISGIHKEILPREQPTICDNLIQYYKTVRHTEFLEPMLNYAATNGELTSSADHEYADIKANREIEPLFACHLPHYDTRCQVDQYTPLFEKFIFITRWRSFEHFSLNRILPREDFDRDIRSNLVTGKEENIVSTSSVLLWALFPDDDTSSEWFKLFDSEVYNKAHAKRKIIREKLNTND